MIGQLWLGPQTKQHYLPVRAARRREPERAVEREEVHWALRPTDLLH